VPVAQTAPVACTCPAHQGSGCVVHAGRQLRSDMAAGARVLHLHSARLWQGYNEVLKTHPVSTKALTCATAYAVGDTIAQLSSTRQHSLPRRLLALDAVRTARLAMFGLLWTGPTGHVFYSWLQRVRLPADGCRD
jgi:hypothetical protein